MKIKIFFTILLITTLVSAGYAMSIMNAGKACTFSSVTGSITFKGKPVKNVVVTRTTDWQKKTSETTTTDDNGDFYFPAKFERSIAKILPQEFAVGQTMSVNFDNQVIQIWDGVKRKPEENHEAKGQPISLTCELTDEKKVMQVNNQPFITICKWDVEQDIIDTGF